MENPVSIVEFIALKDPTQATAYLTAKQDVRGTFGGHNQAATRIRLYFAGGDMPYQVLTVDLFPSQQQAVAYDQELAASRETYLNHRYAMLIAPDQRVPRFLKRLGVLSPLFSFFLGSGKEQALSNERLEEAANPKIGPVPTTLAAFRQLDFGGPFFMMNLNKFFVQSQYEAGQAEKSKGLSGKQAYGLYGRFAVPLLVSVKGYPYIIGEVIQVLEEDSHTSLPDEWDDFVLVYYPSRQHFLRLMTNMSSKAFPHRNAGLERAVLMPCTSLD